MKQLFLAISCIVLLLCFGVGNINAQLPHFRNIEVARPASNIRILRIDQDSLGFLWLGTNKGLLRFNGINYEEIALPDSIREKEITSLNIKNSKILAGFSNGFALVIDYKTSLIPSIYHLGSSTISGCDLDNQNRIWICSAGEGIFILNGSDVTNITTKTGLIDDQVHCIYSFGDHVYAGTDLGLSEIQLKGSSASIQNITVNEGLSDNLITTLTAYGNHSLLIGADNGSLSSLNIHSRKATDVGGLKIRNGSPVQRLFCFEGEAWAITSSNGAWIVNLETNESQYNLSLSTDTKSGSENLTDCILNPGGILIVANGKNQIFVADCQFTYYPSHEGVSFENISAIACDSKGFIWIANDIGIYKHALAFSDDQTLELIYEIKSSDNGIISLCEGPDGSIWFGTFGSGLGRIDYDTQKITRFNERNGLINNNVLSIAKRGNELWMATLGGACKLVLEESSPFTTFSKESELGSNFIYCVVNDNNQNLWFGTDGNGAVELIEGKFEFLKNRFPNIGKSVADMVVDQNNRLWLYSSEEGLQFYNGQSLENISITLNDEKVELFAMELDHLNNVILFTSGGLAKVSSENKSPEFFTSGETFNTNYLNILARDKKNRLWIGDQKGLISFREFHGIRDAQPQTRIQEMLVMLQVADTSIHTYNYDQNHFTFGLAGLWFQQPDAVKFQYRLDGFSLEWVETKDRQLVFPKLPPGKYALHVRTYLGKNIEASNEVVYSFKILHPLWQRLWFIIALSIALIFLGYLLFILRLQNIRKKEEMKSQLFLSQFETLRNQVNPHFLFNSFNTLISTISKDKEEAIDYVEKLSDFFRIILQLRDKDSISLREELELTENYFYLQKKRFGSNLIITLQIDESTLDSLIPPMTLQMLAENALKHNIVTKQKPLHLDVVANQTEIIVSNNLQEKNHKEISTGIGLHNIQSRYKLFFDRNIEIKKTEKKFLVHLPIVTK